MNELSLLGTDRPTDEQLEAVEHSPQTGVMKQVEADVRRQEIQGEVQGALLSLKPKWRLVVIFKDIEGAELRRDCRAIELFHSGIQSETRRE